MLIVVLSLAVTRTSRKYHAIHLQSSPGAQAWTGSAPLQIDAVRVRHSRAVIHNP